MNHEEMNYYIKRVGDLLSDMTVKEQLLVIMAVTDYVDKIKPIVDKYDGKTQTWNLEFLRGDR